MLLYHDGDSPSASLGRWMEGPFSSGGERSPSLCLTQQSIFHSNITSGGYPSWLFLNWQVWHARVLKNWRRILHLKEPSLIVFSNLLNSDLGLVCLAGLCSREYLHTQVPSLRI